MDASLKKMVESIKKRIPMAISVAEDETVSAEIRVRLLLEAVRALPFVVDVLECVDLENATLRRELARMRGEDLKDWGLRDGYDEEPPG